MLLHAAQPPPSSARISSVGSTADSSDRRKSVLSHDSSGSGSSRSVSKHHARVTTGRGGSGNIKRKASAANDGPVEPDATTPIAGRELLGVHPSQGTINAGRGGSGNIKRAMNNKSSLSERTAAIVAQHSVREAEYEYELIKRSAEARRRQKLSNGKSSSGRGGAGNNYLKSTKPPSPKAARFSRARAFTTSDGTRDMAQQNFPIAGNSTFLSAEPLGRQRTVSEPGKGWFRLPIRRRGKDKGKQRAEVAEVAEVADETDDDNQSSTPHDFVAPPAQQQRHMTSVSMQTSDIPASINNPKTPSAFTFGAPAPGHIDFSQVNWSDRFSIASSSWSFHAPQSSGARRSEESVNSIHTFGTHTQSDRASGFGASSFYRLCTASDPMFGRRHSSIRSMSTGNAENIGALMLDTNSDADDSDEYPDDGTSDYEAGASLYAEVAGTEFAAPRTGPRLMVQAPSPTSSSRQLPAYSSGEEADEEIHPSVRSGPTQHSSSLLHA